MKFSRFLRPSIALFFALLAAGVTLVLAQAQNTRPAQPVQGTSTCISCHTEFATAWQKGMHGQAVSNPQFANEWTKQGKPGACLVCHTTGYDPATGTWQEDGVACEACHGPMKAGHPKEPMPVDRSPDLCARCHSDSRFDWQDWQGSTHFQRGMNCTTCHDPHGASLKVSKPLDGSAEYTDASQLCITCHKDVSMDFPYSQHHQRGVSCIDCHVTHTTGNSTDVHALPNHSFKASIDSCNTCHSSQMHTTISTIGTPQPAAASLSDAQLKASGLDPKPTPVSPIGFASLAALLGLAAGMVMAPWLEKWYRRAVKHDEEIKHD
jgi:predicted CXXCH cytochrome family protein